MKILIVRLFPYEINIKNYNVQEIGLAKAMINKGHQCDIVFYTREKERQEKIKIDDKNCITIFWLRGINFFKNGLYGNKIMNLAQNYDIIQSSEYDQIHNIKLNRKLGDKLIIYHGPYYDKFNKGYNLKCSIFDKLFLTEKYKKIKFITKSELATTFLRKKGFENVLTVGVGLDEDKFEKDNMNQEIISKFSENEKYLLYIGKIEERRNILFLIELLKRISLNNNNIKLVLVGQGKKQYIDKVFNYAKELNVYDKIIYIEKVLQNEIKTLYKKCDIFLFPTEYDIFGMVLLESMYFGLPALTTLNGGSSIIMENGKDGFVYNKDVQIWSEKIQELLQDKEYYNAVSEAAKIKIRKRFVWSEIADEFIKKYSEKYNI